MLWPFPLIRGKARLLVGEVIITKIKNYIPILFLKYFAILNIYIDKMSFL